MAGRKAKFSKEQKTLMFENEIEVLVRDNKVRVPSDKIWADMKWKYELRADITEKAIYTAALEFYKAKGVIQNENYLDSEVNLNGSNKSNESIDPDESFEKPQQSQQHVLRFKITLSAKSWSYIKPEREEYHRNSTTDQVRKYYVLKRGSWTCALAEQIAQKRKDIPCRWSFKRGKVYNSGEFYIKVCGSCITCNATLTGILKQKPETPSRSIIFEFEMEGLDLNEHSGQKQKAIRLGGDFARDMYEAPGASIMKRRNAINAATSLCEYPVERVPTSNALRCGKYRLRKFNRLDDCPIKAIQFLKLSDFGQCIRSIGYNPFHSMYATNDQIVMYNIYKKKNKSTIVSCDATGGIAHKIGMT